MAQQCSSCREDPLSDRASPVRADDRGIDLADDDVHHAKVYVVHHHSPGTDVAVNSTRRISIATGSLFIVATVAAVAAAALLPNLTGPDYLTVVAGHTNRMAA